MIATPGQPGDSCAQDTHPTGFAFPSGRPAPCPPDGLPPGLPERTPCAGGCKAAERSSRLTRPLTPEQQALAARHIGLVGVHLRTRLGSRRRQGADRDELGELFQIGCLALVQAAAGYAPERHGDFAAYALLRIRRAIHAAALTGRHVVRVPYGQACKDPQAVAPVSLQPHPDLRTAAGPTTGEWLDQRAACDTESIRHALRRRFELATREAVESLLHRSWRRPDAPAIFARIAAERVLISNPRQRTPVRQLAGELHISAGQVHAYEQHILRVAREWLRDDAAARLLVRFAQRDPAGFDGPVHAARRRQLRRVEVRQFERRFARLDPEEQARTLYRLVKCSSVGVGEVARNLFLLSRRDS